MPRRRRRKKPNWKYPCAGIGCGKPVKCTQNSLECDLCKKWVHLKCTNLSDEQFEFLASNENLPFYCLNCKPRSCYTDLIFDDENDSSSDVSADVLSPQLNANITDFVASHDSTMDTFF